MTAKHKESTYGWMLVCAQFLLIGVLIMQIFSANPLRLLFASFTGGSFLLAGLALFTLTQYYNRPGNWSVHPHLKDGGEFVTTGPYKWIRHPMYSAALLAAAGATIFAPNWISVLCMLALVVVFVLKINIEERELAQKFPGWTDYASKTKRLIPNVW